jgi:hypothetical protein
MTLPAFTAYIDATLPHKKSEETTKMELVPVDSAEYRRYFFSLQKVNLALRQALTENASSPNISPLFALPFFSSLLQADYLNRHVREYEFKEDDLDSDTQEQIAIISTSGPEQLLGQAYVFYCYSNKQSGIGAGLFFDTRKQLSDNERISLEQCFNELPMSSGGLSVVSDQALGMFTKLLLLSASVTTVQKSEPEQPRPIPQENNNIGITKALIILLLLFSVAYLLRSDNEVAAVPCRPEL